MFNFVNLAAETQARN